MKFMPIITLLLITLISCGKKPAATASVEPDADVQPTYATENNEVVSNVTARSTGPYTVNIGRYHELFNDSNYLQYQAAEKMGIEPIHTLDLAFNTRRPILRVESGPNFKVDDLTHSMPFLVPEALQLLNEIGKAFGDTLASRGGDRSNRIIVTSLLRTPHSVKKLRRVNRNAVDSSTHTFGTTFDISWYNFDCPDPQKEVNHDILKGILAEVLLAKRNEGRCYVKYEHKSPCFHITVRE